MAGDDSSTQKSASVPEASLSAASLEPVRLDLSIPEVLDQMVFRGPPVIIDRSYINSGFHNSPEIMAARCAISRVEQRQSRARKSAWCVHRMGEAVHQRQGGGVGQGACQPDNVLYVKSGGR